MVRVVGRAETDRPTDQPFVYRIIIANGCSRNKCRTNLDNLPPHYYVLTTTTSLTEYSLQKFQLNWNSLCGASPLNSQPAAVSHVLCGFGFRFCCFFCYILLFGFFLLFLLPVRITVQRKKKALAISWQSYEIHFDQHKKNNRDTEVGRIQK